MNKKLVRTLLKSLSGIGLTSLVAPSAFAVVYTLSPGNGEASLVWGNSANWGGSGTPGSAAGDTAIISGAFGGVNQAVDLSAPLVSPLVSITLGDTTGTGTSTIQSSNGTALALASGATIISTGAAGATNLISAPVTIAGGFTINGPASSPAVTDNNPLTMSGKITPSVSGNKNIDNTSGRTLTLGDIDLSTGTSASTISIRAGGTGAATIGSNIVLGGVIADGSSVASALTLGARSGTVTTSMSYIQIDGHNTYTGNTTLGVQSNVHTVYRINSNQPFGAADTGSLTIGSGSQANFLEAVGQDRVIAKNTTTINRPIGFQGSHSVTLAANTLNLSNNAAGTGVTFFMNNITAPGKTATIGSPGSVMNLNNGAGDFFRLRSLSGGGTTIIAASMADNSGTVPADSRMVIQNEGVGTLILTGTNTYQGSTRITGTGTIQLGNGGTTGSLNPGHDSNLVTEGVNSVAIVNSTAAGTLAFNRSDDVVSTLTTNGPLGIAQRGSGSLTLSNSQFNSGANVVGDGVTPTTLIVSGAAIPSVSTTGATITNSASAQLAINNVTLTGGATTSGLNLKVGQPVFLTGSPSSVAYVDSILSATSFRVGGLQVSSSVGPLASGTGVSLTFGEGSALGTSSAVTTVNNLGTLAGTGVIAGSVNALAGSFLAPGASEGAAGVLTTGALGLTGATLVYDLAATAGGMSDSLVSSGAVSFTNLTFDFSAITAGTIELGATYNLITATGAIVGDVGAISTTFSNDLLGFYSAAYALNDVGGTNQLSVTFAAIPEPSSFAALAGLVMLGVGLTRRRRATVG